MEKIKVENLYKIFGSHPDRAVDLLNEGCSKEEIMEKTGCGVGVADVTFQVNEGEILVIMGLSGSGKSTLVRCINRLIDPTSGNVFVDGENVVDLNLDDLRRFRQKHFGMVFQNFGLFPHRTVLKNVEFGLEVQRVDPKECESAAFKALEQVGLKGWEHSFPDQLSGGMQQRVGLARALALDADIMLMDEAFSALDPLIRRDMQDELLALQDKMQKTIVFISHDLDEALRLGDRIILMKDGAIVQTGTAEEILTNPANEYVAKFVEDVDMTKVVTAESVMIKHAPISFYETDGPAAAVRKMRNENTDYIFVRKDKKLKGVVSIESAAEAKKRKDPNLESILDENIIKVLPDTFTNELFPLLSNTQYPLAVVDDDGRLLGIITKTSFLAGLAETSA